MCAQLLGANAHGLRAMLAPPGAATRLAGRQLVPHPSTRGMRRCSAKRRRLRAAAPGRCASSRRTPVSPRRPFLSFHRLHRPSLVAPLSSPILFESAYCPGRAFGGDSGGVIHGGRRLGTSQHGCAPLCPSGSRASCACIARRQLPELPGLGPLEYVHPLISPSVHPFPPESAAVGRGRRPGGLHACPIWVAEREIIPSTRSKHAIAGADPGPAVSTRIQLL